ncbi:hypothetical protein H4R33_005417 [Dimargaris cristalligena]|nr:hypothetical protein H4R33_005417 [Dimargaris cristalligena]
MPVRHFDYFTAERQLIQTSPLNVLNGIRVGIDGNHWLRKLLQRVVRDPYPAAMGGIPLGLEAAVERELNAFKSHQIHPFFVFSGVNLLRKDKPFSKPDSRPNKRTNAWKAYDNQQLDLALSSWGSSGSISPLDMLPEVFRLLALHGVEFMRAPYSAWGQLIYLQKHPQAPIHTIHAGSEMLIFDVDRVIVSLDFDKGTFAWLSKRQTLQDLDISPEQFLDVCILAGFDWSITFPPLEGDTKGFTFKDVLELIKQHKTGFNAVQKYSDNPQVIKVKYVDSFCRTRCAVKYHLILNTEGHVVPLNADQAPSDIHEFIGYRFPDSVYLYLAQGLIGPQVLNNLVSGFLLETAPICNGETSEYKKLLTELLPLRTKTLALLSSCLNQFYHNRKVATMYYFEPTVEHIIAHSKTTVAPIMVDVEAVDRLGIRSVGFKNCLSALLTPSLPHLQARDTPAYLKTPSQILASVNLTVLAETGFIDKQYKATAYGRALLASCQTFLTIKEPRTLTVGINGADSPTMFFPELLVGLLLIRYHILKPEPFSVVYDTPKAHPFWASLDDSVRRHLTLITRAVSLIPGRFNAKTPTTGWKGTAPLSRDLLAFNSCARAVTKTLRNLTEMATLHLFLTNRVAKPQGNHYLTIGQGLPFDKEVNTGMGMLALTYLEQRLKGPQEQATASPTSTATATTTTTPATSPATVEAALETVRSTLGSFDDPKADLVRAFQFWDEVMAAVKTLAKANADSSGIDPKLAEAFQAADQWLKPLRL